MVDVFDMLRCPACGAFYKPKVADDTYFMLPHCLGGHGRLVEQGALTRVEWLDGEVIIDWDAIEARVVQAMLTGGVVDPLLTESILDIEV